MGLDPKTVGHLMQHGHTVHAERGSYTHSVFRQAIPADAEILKKGEPIYIGGLDRNLIAGDVLPERLALAVDLDANGKANVLPQEEFNLRYQNYLTEMKIKGDPALEPIPDIDDYITTIVDPISIGTNHLKFTALGFDPEATGPAQNLGNYGPDGETIEVYREKQALADGKTAKAKVLHELAADGIITAEKLAEQMAEIYGVPEPDVEEPEETPEPAEEPAPIAASPTEGMVAAPCGKACKARGEHAHIYHCSEPACKSAQAEKDQGKE